MGGQRLEGADVVRGRSVEERFPGATDVTTRVMQGKRVRGGECSYAFEFYESFEEASPKVGAVTAVQPSTCKFELQVGVPTNNACPDVADGVSRTVRTVLPGRRTGAAPSCRESRSGIEPASHFNRKATVYARWEDRFGIDTNKLLAAVRSETVDQDVTGGECIVDRWWRKGTGRDLRKDGKWFNDTCRRGGSWVQAKANAHFGNSKFPTCVPNTVHVYYDNLWVTVTTTDRDYPAGWYYGMDDTWAEGDNCRRLLKFAGFLWFPGEYWGF
jgi:hypothetical protein